MELVLCIPTYNRYRDTLVDCVQSAMRGIREPDSILVWDNAPNGAFTRYYQENPEKYPILEIMGIGKNLGCAIPWNIFLHQIHQRNPDAHVIIANDDITFLPDTLQLFEDAINRYPDEVLYVTGGIKSQNAFSLFATNFTKMQRSGGLFDTTFVYPYCEDGDRYITLRQSGHDFYRIEQCSADHVGSATLQHYDPTEQRLHHTRFERNAYYFKQKWGIDHNAIHTAVPYPQPFNGDRTLEQLTRSYMYITYGY